VPTDIDVRHAQKSDVRALSATLGRAFYDDPIMKWMLPDDARRARALPRMWATMTRHHYLAGGGAEVATNGSDVGAATLWDPPGRWKQTPIEELRMAPAFLMAFRSRMAGAQKIADLMKEKHPEEPHWYLFAIGSDPTVRGGGFGQALMRSRLDRCDAEHAPAYLESTKQ
jgi:GNAT superfamily N-acetyltransferase